jgi:para-nitrobenzyl esterase
MSDQHAQSAPAGARQDVDRRDWMKQAATLLGGAAAGAAGTSLTSPTSLEAAAAPGDTHVATPEAGVVETTAGKVRGFTRNGVYIYRGIPYGDTTSGENRFMPPQKPKPWTGVRSSTSWGPVSPQGPRAGWRNDEEQFLYQWDDGFQGEDMLRVNVWTPAVNDTRRRPVLVWIHGGGFVSGSSQELRPYDGENLAKRHDVVLVSLNHRLNVFGFLDLSQMGGAKYATSGNASMLDLVLALEWVRDNIARFGGDPGNVTIFGQSGGGRKVSTLLAMPGAKGLFHKAAVMSGSHLKQFTPDVSARLANAVLTELGVTRASLDTLHQLPYERILGAALDAQRKLAQGATAAAPAPNWGPVVDGTVLPRHAFDPDASPLAAGVPMLIGNTFAEFGGGMNNPAAHLLTLEQLRDKLSPTYGARTGDLIAAYQKVLPQAKPFEIAAVITGTTSYRINAVTQVELKSAQSSPVYNFWFWWKTSVLDGRPLPYHCQDLAFWFDNIDLAAQATGGTDDARDLAAKMSGAFVAFARTGNPVHAGLPKWDRFTAANRAVMVFENDGRSSQRIDPDREARTLLKTLMA